MFAQFEMSSLVKTLFEDDLQSLIASLMDFLSTFGLIKQWFLS